MSIPDEGLTGEQSEALAWLIRYWSRNQRHAAISELRDGLGWTYTKTAQVVGALTVSRYLNLGHYAERHQVATILRGVDGRAVRAQLVAS